MKASGQGESGLRRQCKGQRKACMARVVGFGWRGFGLACVCVFAPVPSCPFRLHAFLYSGVCSFSKVGFRVWAVAVVTRHPGEFSLPRVGPGLHSFSSTSWHVCCALFSSALHRGFPKLLPLYSFMFFPFATVLLTGLPAVTAPHFISIFL